MRLKDKVAIVTGAAHGMGEAEARLFAKKEPGSSSQISSKSRLKRSPLISVRGEAMLPPRRSTSPASRLARR